MVFKSTIIFLMLVSIVISGCSDSGKLENIVAKPTIEIAKSSSLIVVENTSRVTRIILAYVVPPEFMQKHEVKLTLSGDDSDLFALKGKELYFKEVPDYEHPKDKNKDNIYDVVISASLLPTPATTKQDFHITVIDDYENSIKKEYVRDDNKQIVFDKSLKLMWQDDNETITVKKQWLSDVNYNAKNFLDTSGDTAKTYCENLHLLEHNDWRLPTIQELNSLIENKQINSTFQNIVLKEYWSSTTHDGNEKNAFTLSFGNGYVISHAKDNSLDIGNGEYMKGSGVYIRCVRQYE